MRLIDADALIENCKKYLNALNPDREVKEFARIYWLIGVLENTPTIEPESCEDAVSRKEVLTIVEELQARAGKLDEGLIRSAVEATLKPIREITNRLPAAQPDHIAESDRKVSISCGQENDLISRRAALKELAVYIHMIDKTMGKGTLTDDDCMEAAKSVLGEDELPAVQPETATVTIGRTRGECGNVVRM